MNDPWTWTTVWELTMRARGGMNRGGQRGKHWDNCNRIIIKNDLKRKKEDNEKQFSLVIA